MRMILVNSASALLPITYLGLILPYKMFRITKACGSCIPYISACRGGEGESKNLLFEAPYDVFSLYSEAEGQES